MALKSDLGFVMMRLPVKDGDPADFDGKGAVAGKRMKLGVSPSLNSRRLAPAWSGQPGRVRRGGIFYGKV